MIFTISMILPDPREGHRADDAARAGAVVAMLLRRYADICDGNQRFQPDTAYHTFSTDDGQLIGTADLEASPATPQ